MQSGTGRKNQAAISLTFDLHCKAIAALFIILYCHPVVVRGFCDFMADFEHNLRQKEPNFKSMRDLMLLQRRWFENSLCNCVHSLPSLLIVIFENLLHLTRTILLIVLDLTDMTRTYLNRNLVICVYMSALQLLFTHRYGFIFIHDSHSQMSTNCPFKISFKMPLIIYMKGIFRCKNRLK